MENPFSKMYNYNDSKHYFEKKIVLEYFGYDIFVLHHFINSLDIAGCSACYGMQFISFNLSDHFEMINLSISSTIY